MPPLEQYNELILTRQQNPLPKEEYGEVHHIIPRSLGGCDKAWNKVRLTPEEHFSCHYLLTFIYATGEAHEAMVYAWNQLSGRITGDLISSEEYGRLRREFAKIHSKRMKGMSPWNKGKKTGPQSEEWRKAIGDGNRGRTSPFKGKHFSEETKRKMSEAKKGKSRPNMKGRAPWNKGLKTGPHSEESNRKRSLTLRGRVVSQETRHKLSIALTGRHPSEESKQKNRLAHLGRKHTEEWKRMMSERAKAGYPKQS